MFTITTDNKMWMQTVAFVGIKAPSNDAGMVPKIVLVTYVVIHTNKLRCMVVRTAR